MNLELKDMYDIKNIVKSKAKYQKVMLVFDDSISETKTRDIYELIREDCIYNQSNISSFDEKELMDGYRLVIFYMTGQSFLSLGIPTNEFVNIFIPTDANILPFFVDGNFNLSKQKDYIILNSAEIDNSMLTSIYFNRVYTYVNNIIYGMDKLENSGKIDLDFLCLDPIKVLKNERLNTKFLDLAILVQSGLNIERLPLLDFVLIVGFELFLKSIREQTLSMIDVYKVARNDDDKINKYYEMMNNYTLLEILNLNFNCASNYIKTNKGHVLELLGNNYTNEEVLTVIRNIKEYAKEDDGILGNMYFYNIFSI